MDWFKQHADSISVIAVIVVAMMWMNTRLNEIEKDVTIIKTVLIMRNLMPSELAKSSANNINEMSKKG